MKLTSTIYPVCVTRVTPSRVHNGLISYGRFTVVFNVLMICFIGCVVGSNVPSRILISSN